MFYAVFSVLFLHVNIEWRMVYFVDLVRYIILERVALNMCSSRYLRGMPFMLQIYRNCLTASWKSHRQLAIKDTLLTSSPTGCVQTRGIVNKSVGKQTTNKKQLDHRGCQRQVFLASPNNVYIQALKLLLGKGTNLKLEIILSLVMGLRDFWKGSSLALISSKS